MKRKLMIIAVAVIAMAAIVFAGGVADYAVQALSTTAGTAVYTATADYAATVVTGIRISANTDAGATVTVSRVVASGAYTNTVGTIAALGYLNLNTNPAILKYGDSLLFANSTATGAVSVVEFSVQRP